MTGKNRVGSMKVIRIMIVITVVIYGGLIRFWF